MRPVLVLNELMNKMYWWSIECCWPCLYCYKQKITITSLTVLTLVPIWFPHWPAWMWTISRIFFHKCRRSAQRLDGGSAQPPSSVKRVHATAPRWDDICPIRRWQMICQSCVKARACASCSATACLNDQLINKTWSHQKLVIGYRIDLILVKKIYIMFINKMYHE